MSHSSAGVMLSLSVQGNVRQTAIAPQLPASSSLAHREPTLPSSAVVNIIITSSARTIDPTERYRESVNSLQ